MHTHKQAMDSLEYSSFGKTGRICSVGMLCAMMSCQRKYCSIDSHSRLSSTRNQRLLLVAVSYYIKITENSFLPYPFAINSFINFTYLLPGEMHFTQPLV